MSARFLILLHSCELLIQQQIKLNFKGRARLYSEQIAPSAQSQLSKYWWAAKYVCSPCDVGMIQTFPVEGQGGLIKGFHCYQVITTPLHLFFLVFVSSPQSTTALFCAKMPLMCVPVKQSTPKGFNSRQNSLSCKFSYSNESLLFVSQLLRNEKSPDFAFVLVPLFRKQQQQMHSGL